MWLMSRLRVLPSCSLLIPVLLASGCSRPASLDELGSPTAQPQIPFNGSERQSRQSSTQRNSETAATDTSQSANVLPFRDARGLPAGTLLTVRLTRAVSTEQSDRPFEAILENPVIVEGHTLIPGGAKASGLVESARASQLRRDRGYVRLRLSSIEIHGHHVPVETSSLFAKGSPVERADDPAGVSIGLKNGHRLTFRLSGPLIFASQRENLVP